MTRFPILYIFAYVLSSFAYQFTLELPKWPDFNFKKLTINNSHVLWIPLYVRTWRLACNFQILFISFHGENMKVIVLSCFQNIPNKAIFMDFCTENDKMQLWLICSLIQLSKVAEAWIFFSFFPYSPIPNTHDTIMNRTSSETL